MPSRLFVALLAATLVSACALAPEYRVPAVPVADAYQGTGPWSAAQPGQALPHDGWWRVYQDAQLDTLQQRFARDYAMPLLGVIPYLSSPTAAQAAVHLDIQSLRIPALGNA